MPESEKTQLKKLVMTSYRNWGCVIQFAWIIMDILDSMRWAADETLGERRDVLNLQQIILIFVMTSVHILAFVKLEISSLCVFVHFFKFCWVHPYENYLQSCYYEPLRFGEMTISLIPSFCIRSFSIIVLILWNLQYNFLQHRKNQYVKATKEELDTILQKMIQSVVLIKDNKIKFTNENFRYMVKNNINAFGITVQNPSIELDDILDFEFLKIYQTKKQFFDNSFVEPLASH